LKVGVVGAKGIRGWIHCPPLYLSVVGKNFIENILKVSYCCMYPLMSSVYIRIMIAFSS
jgi:hypothetical protein